MSTDEERREDARRETWEDANPLAACPTCHHESFRITSSLPATRIDPACFTGYCTCKRRNAEVAAGREQCEECGPNVSDIHYGRCQGCGADIYYQGRADHGVLNLFERVPARCGPIDPPTETCDCACHCQCGSET